MPVTKEKITIYRCEKCDREVKDAITLRAPDNSEQCVCWSCFTRGEKRANVKTDWKRSRRA